MSLTLALLVGAIQLEPASVQKLDDLALFRRVNRESFDAIDKYRCQGLAPLAARSAADRALGHRFSERLRLAASVLNTRYDPKAVENAGIFVAIGYKITEARCRAVRTIVKDALSDMAKLERRLGID